MRNFVKRTVSLLLTAAMMATLLTGCGKSEAPAGKDDGAAPMEKGRYVEQEMALPEDIDAENIKQVFRYKGKLRLLVLENADETTRLREWELNGDSFTELTGDWMKQISYPYAPYGQAQILQAEDGTSYLFATVMQDEENSAGRLWKGGADGSLTEITPEGWTVKNEEYGFYEYPNRLMLLGDGILAAMYYDRMEYYSAEDGSITGNMPFAGSYGNYADSSGENFYLISMDDAGKISGVEVYNEKSQEPSRTIPLTQERERNNLISVLPDGTMIVLGGDGLFRCAPGSDNWEKLMDGSDTSMALVDRGAISLAALEDGTCYALYSGSGSYIAQYRYDENAVVGIEETLQIYSVYDSFLLQQAAALFHRKHPEVKIEIETAGTYSMYGEDMDFQQIYQNLNTRLMAGEGPDMLVMDNLNLASFEDKGLLSDISDVVGPLEEQGELLKNITGTYVREDGKRYVTPLQFSIVLSVGRQVDVGAMRDMPSLADALSKTSESLMGPRTPDELVDMFLPYFVEDLTKGKELDKEALKTNLQYLKAIGENCGVIMQRDKGERAYNIWNLTYQAKLVLQEVEGFQQAMLPLSVANLAKGDFAAFGNAFYPSLHMGIYSKSGKQDLAKEFLSFVLSGEIQDHDYYEGFPVNAKSLEYQKGLDRSDAEAFTMIEVAEGMEEEFIIGVFPEEDAEKLTNACRTVNKRAGRDQEIAIKISEALPGYLDGSLSLDDAADQIEAGLRMYLAE